MVEVLSADQMREIEKNAIDAGSVTGLALMERAGAGVVEAVFEAWPSFANGGHRAVVLCGPGNNGGDGFVVARLLRQAGWDVDVFLYGRVQALPQAARSAAESYLDVGKIHPLSHPHPTAPEIAHFAALASRIPEIEKRPDEDSYPPFLLVDALFGIGLNRPLPDGLVDLVSHWDYLTNFRDLNDSRIIAIDVASGLDARNGEIIRGPHTVFGVLHADLTVTFHTLKPCHLTQFGRISCGKVVVKDIGL